MNLPSITTSPEILFLLTVAVPDGVRRARCGARRALVRSDSNEGGSSERKSSRRSYFRTNSPAEEEVGRTMTGLVIVLRVLEEAQHEPFGNCARCGLRSLEFWRMCSVTGRRNSLIASERTRRYNESRDSGRKAFETR